MKKPQIEAEVNALLSAILIGGIAAIILITISGCARITYDYTPLEPTTIIQLPKETKNDQTTINDK